MRHEVFALPVSCTFMEDGCSWKGEVRNLEVWSYLYVHSTSKMQNVEFMFVLHLLLNGSWSELMEFIFLAS